MVFPVLRFMNETDVKPVMRKVIEPSEVLRTLKNFMLTGSVLETRVQVAAAGPTMTHQIARRAAGLPAAPPPLRAAGPPAAPRRAKPAPPHSAGLCHESLRRLSRWRAVGLTGQMLDHSRHMPSSGDGEAATQYYQERSTGQRKASR